MSAHEKKKRLEHTVFILPARIQKARLLLFQSKCNSVGIEVVTTPCAKVTHVVTNFETPENILDYAKKKDLPIDLEKVEFVKLDWLSECLKFKDVVDIEKYRISLPKTCSNTNTNIDVDIVPVEDWPEYSCQRQTPLNHHNHHLTNPLQILEEHAEMQGGGDSFNSRSLAFHRCIAVLKSYPQNIVSAKVTARLPYIGAHCQRIIKDILETGKSDEVEEILATPSFHHMKELMSVFGVGQAIAKKWLGCGVASVSAAQGDPAIGEMSNRQIIYGLAFHDDLTFPVSRLEATCVETFLKDLANDLLPGVIVTLTGGFRRGKLTGHDIDFLLTHPEEGKEDGLLTMLLTQLRQKNLLLYDPTVETNSYNLHTHTSTHELRNNMDHFEKWMGIMKLNKKLQNGEDFVAEERTDGICQFLSLVDALKVARSSRNWCARRIDLVVVPYSQFFFALVGWTGSKHFNRDLRLYAQKKLKMKLTSHGLFPSKQMESLPASSEAEVFENLQLPCFPPDQRNS